MELIQHNKEIIRVAISIIDINYFVCLEALKYMFFFNLQNIVHIYIKCFSRRFVDSFLRILGLEDEFLPAEFPFAESPYTSDRGQQKTYNPLSCFDSATKDRLL